LRYSQEARPYALALFLTIISFYCFVRLFEKETGLLRSGYIIATVGAYYAHYLFGFIIVIQIAYVMFYRGRVRTSWKHWLILWAISAALMAPGLFQLSVLSHRDETYSWLPPVSAGTMLGLILDLIDAPVFLPAAALSLALYWMRREKAESETESDSNMPLLFFWFALPVLFIFTIAVSLKIVLLHPRYVVYVVPATCLGLGALIGRNRKNSVWFPLTLFLVLSAAVHVVPSLKRSATFAEHPNENWEDAARFLEASLQKGDAVLYNSGFVEADWIVDSRLDPLTKSFVLWPLQANSRTPLPVTILPYHLDREAVLYVSRMIATSGSSRRIWMIGVDMQKYVTRDLRAIAVHHFGDVDVYLLHKDS